MNRLYTTTLTIAAAATMQSCYATQPVAAEIVLDSKLLALIDGSFINADTIEVMQKFQRKLISILLGDRDAQGKRVGRYTWNNARYGVRALKELENARGAAELLSVLRDAKEDFVKTSEEFKTFVSHSKKTIGVLVENSCEKRDRTDSLLLEWAKSSEVDEALIFDRGVNSFADLDQFVVDLMNFLGDMIRSCPRAQELFKIRLQKFAKINELMPTLMADKPAANAGPFLKYLKTQYLDGMKLEEISTGRLQDLYTSFAKNRAK